jgi:hypothetical protein
MKKEARIQCIHPEGKQAPSISADTYALFEKAIFHSLKARKQPISYTELMEEVKKYFAKQQPNFKGSIGWYGVIVKNHMEATGILKTFTEKGKKLHTLA